MSLLPCVEVEPKQPANAAIIWLHGLGADGHDFEPIVPHIQFAEGVHARFVFPHAPRIPVTINGGMQMPAWYDILEMSINRNVDETQLRASAAQTVALIEREIERGIPAERIVLAGFSQGGAVAYEAALSFQKKLAGVMCLSTYLATQASVKTSEAQKTTPFLVQHGSQDPVVPAQLGTQAKAWLEEHGYAVTYQTYPMAHQVCAEQLQDISKFLQSVLR
ncbi:carboxylesterase [Aliidiomarina shirensis]|uniref:Carboxylesterase n=1 Tax=Aliidiomarina shirensis TaxID=1048642 RepID=A0A432WVF5_9GAMM|nr:alpha/beta fold hydrolase [Aliidiomarina shirensis]RUO37751.1 carboxylesterase [Aliidiomarina shirensis]